MADRYWVGGDGNWNTTNTGNWASTSGGASGASAPTSADDVFFDANSDAGAGFTVTVVATGPTCKNLTVSGLDQTMALAGSTGFTVQGTISLPASNFSWTHTGTVTLSGTAAQTLTTNGVSVAGSITINKSSGTVTLGSALTIGSTRNLTLTSGGLDAANFNVTAGNVVSNNSNTRTLTMGSGTWTVQDSGTSWNMATITNLTLNENTSTILMTSASAKTFSGGGETFYNLSQGGAGVLTIAGANTFNDIQNAYSATAATTIRLTISITQTVSNFTASGTSGKVLTLDSTSAGTAATLSKSSGAVSVSYLSIKDSTATGGATWNASNSTNVSGNTGWTFGTAYSMAAATGTFTLTGNAAALKADRKLAAAQAAFTLTGNATGLKAARKLVAAFGQFILTGNAAGLSYSGGAKVLTAASGTFTLTGQAASLKVARVLSAASGNFALTGNDAALTYTSVGYTMTADGASYALTGGEATFTISQFWTPVSANSETWNPVAATSEIWTVQ